MTRRALLLPGLALATSLVAEAPSAQPSAEWIKHTKVRIEFLLGPRHDTTPPPASIPNPFRLPGQSDSGTSQAVGPAAGPQTTDTENLARLAATLTLNGIVQIGGGTQVIINQLAYKEGDLVAVREAGQATYLRVIHITNVGLTLELNKAERTIHLK